MLGALRVKSRRAGLVGPLAAVEGVAGDSWRRQLISSRPWHTDHALIESAAAIFRSTGVAEVHSIPELLDLIEAHTGLPVQVKERDDPELKQFAALLALPNRQLMVLRKFDPHFCKARGLFHECGHLLFNHDECVVFSQLYGAQSNDAHSQSAGVDLRRVEHEAQAEALGIMIERHLSKPGFRRDEEAF